MSNTSKFRFLGLVVLAGAVSFTSGSLQAQTNGGSFGSAPTPQRSVQMNFGSPQPDNSVQERADFNSIPFTRIDKDSSKGLLKPLTNQAPPKVQQFGTPLKPQPKIQQKSVSQKQLAPRTQLRQASSTTAPPIRLSANPQEGTSRQFSGNSFNRNSTLPATNAGSTRQLSSNENNGSTGSLPKYLDLTGTVRFIDDIQLPAQVPGVIATLDVKEGESIPAGKIIGMIDDSMGRILADQARLDFEYAEEQAMDTTAIRAAEKKYRVAGIEAEKTRKLAMSGSKSKSDKLMADYTKDISLIEHEKAMREKKATLIQKKVAAAKYMEAQTRIEQHTLRCNYDAYVVQVFKKPQEYVQPGDPVVRIGRMDKLWVQGTVDIADVNPYEVKDRPVTVTVRLARNQTATFEGKVDVVSLERQGLTRYLIKAEITNKPVAGHWVLHPLGEAKMRIHLDGNQASGGFDPVKSKVQR